LESGDGQRADRDIDNPATLPLDVYSNNKVATENAIFSCPPGLILVRRVSRILPANSAAVLCDLRSQKLFTAESAEKSVRAAIAICRDRC